MSVGERRESFISRVVQDTRYGSASEVVRAGLRLLEEHDTRLAALRAALDEGEASGYDEEFDFDAFIESETKGSVSLA